jgi:hypothetical protein
VLGEWSSKQTAALLDNLLQGNTTFDVVLVDYLVGAMDGFTPYEQDMIFAQLRQYTGQRMYAVGQEPYRLPRDSKHNTKRRDYMDSLDGEELAREIAMSVMKLRDATILLTGERPYRYEILLCALTNKGSSP